MWRRCFTLVLILGLNLILLQIIYIISIADNKSHWKTFDFTVKNLNENEDDLSNTGFSINEYEEAKIDETNIENMYKISAVLLHWKRLYGIRRTVRYLVSSGLFEEIIIWNNNPKINLTINYFAKNSKSLKLIRIINSKHNLKDEAKYRACAKAKNPACFYVDDDWNVSKYTRSLISSFRSDPSLLHTVTDTYTYYTNLVWTYFDDQISLHSGFSWIGCGSLFLRRHAKKHIKLLYKYLKNDPNLIGFGDAFFSIWLNNIPVQMNTNIVNHPSSYYEDSASFSSTYNFSISQYKSSILAIRILENSLRSDKIDSIFPFEENRRFPYYVKSPNINDDFIFYTNIIPYKFKDVSFNIKRDFLRGTRKNLPSDPNSQYYCKHSTLHAVDNDLSTCWSANRFINLGDFFAIDFLHIQRNIRFTIAVAHSPIIQRNLQIKISFDGLNWKYYRSLKGIFTKMNRTLEYHVHTFLFDSTQFTSGFQSFRYISFKANQDYDHRFQICQIQIISLKIRENINDQFYPLEYIKSSNNLL